MSILLIDGQIAEFSEILRASYWAHGSKLDEVHTLARQCRRDYDDRADIKELVELIGKSRDLKADQRNFSASSTEQ